MRKSIFAMLQTNDKVNVKLEYEKIEALFNMKNVVGITSIYEYASNNLVPIWNFRHRCVTMSELYKLLEIDSTSIRNSGYELNKILSYFELVYTFTQMVSRCAWGPSAYYTYRNSISYDFLQGKNINLITENIESFLEDLNYEIKKIDVDRYEIVEKHALATEVAEDYPSIANEIIEYRKYDLKGDIKSKREILKVLADSIELLKDVFKGTTYYSLYDDTTFLLNNLNIRHNNEEDKLYNELYKNKEIEQWYDTTYNCILNVLAINEYLSINKNVDQLKKKMK